MAVPSDARLAISVPTGSVLRVRKKTGSLALTTATAGMLSAGAVIALFGVGLPAVAVLLVAIVASASMPRLHPVLARTALRRAKVARRLARRRAIAPSLFAMQTLAELTLLVDQIESDDPATARRLDLEALLDRYVIVTLAQERALRAASMSDRLQLERDRMLCRADLHPDPRRIDLTERRIALLDRCEAMASSLSGELSTITDLVRLIAQQVACPEDLAADDTIERQLADLDERDAARRQIANELR